MTERDQTLLQSAIDFAKAGAGFVADLLERIVGGIKGLMIAPLALAFGCQQTSDAADKPAPQPEIAVVAPAKEADDTPKKLGLFTITFYYVANEDEVAASKKPAKPAAVNDNTETELASIAPVDEPQEEKVSLYSKDCTVIAEVSRAFASQLSIQGTGKLRDGRMLNVSGHCSCEFSPCFHELVAQVWGTAGSGRPLQPFRTVAVDPKVIKLGSLLYVPLLEGRVMPGRPPWGGFVHDGCVVADDTGGGIKGEQLDLFVGKKGWFHGMAAYGGSHAWARHVPVFDGAKLCERKGRHIARKVGGV